MEGVFIFDESHSHMAVSGPQGEADISGFFRNESIFFSHQSYETLERSFDQIRESNFRVAFLDKVSIFNNVVVLAERWQPVEFRLPQQSLQVDISSQQFNNPQTSADLLASSGQVYVQKSQYGGGSPMLRGFGANKILLAMDDIRLNNAIYRGGNLQNVINVDPNMVELVTVHYGPGAAMFGSDALGGVVSFKIKDPVLSESKKPEVHGQVGTRLASAASERTAHAEVNIANNKIAYLGSGSFSALGDLRSGRLSSRAFYNYFRNDYYVETGTGPGFIPDTLKINGRPEVQKFSGFSLWHTIHKLRVQILPSLYVQYAFYHSTTSDIPRYDRLQLRSSQAPSTRPLVYSEWYYGPQTLTTHAFDVQWSAPAGMFDKLKLKLVRQEYSESRHVRRFQSDWKQQQQEQVDVLALKFDAEKEIGGLELLAGTDFYVNRITSKARLLEEHLSRVSHLDSRYPSFGNESRALGIFCILNQEFGLGWTLTAGVRYSVLNLKVKDDPLRSSIRDLDLSNSTVTASMGIKYGLLNNFQIGLLFSSGFRAPNLDDVGKLFELDGDDVVVPNQDLKPENVYNQEIKARYKPLPSLTLDFVLFHAWWVNPIVRDVFAFNGSPVLTVGGEEKRVLSNINSTSNTRLWGGSARVNFSLSRYLHFSSVMSANEGRELNTDEPPRHVTPVFGQTTLAYEKRRMKLSASLDYHLSRGKSRINSREIEGKPYLFTDKGSPGWITLSLRSSFRLNSDRILLFAGIENVFDAYYRTYSSGINAPGINFYTSVRYKF